MSSGQTATLRAKVRWLKGHPEILLRLKGNWLEATGNILTARNLGTPGAPNSQARPNVGPAVTAVKHSPVVPTASQPVTVCARPRFRRSRLARVEVSCRSLRRT